MRNSLTPETIDLAVSYLRAFGRETRKRGEVCYLEGHVVKVVCQEPDTTYSALVRDPFDYWTTLHFEGVWNAICSCPMSGRCRHAYAAMMGLLAEHGVHPPEADQEEETVAVPLPAKKESAHARFVRMVTEGLGRSLLQDESRFLNKLTRLYAESQRRGGLFASELVTLGLRVPGPLFEPLALWPTPPRDEHEFWLYIANAAAEHEIGIPEFLEPVTDLTEVQARIHEWRRQREVDEWSHRLANRFRVLEGPKEPAVNYDLRLALRPSAAEYEVKRSEWDDFRPLTVGELRRLERQESAGLVRLARSAELLWPFLRQWKGIEELPTLRYNRGSDQNVLNRFVRNPTLRDRIVTETGTPVVRVKDPIRWELTEPKDGQDDYRLRLIQADGSALHSYLGALDGQPPLYLTRKAIFPGPPLESQLLDPARVTMVPAEALETSWGVELLDALKIEPPARIQKRIRRVALKPRVQCSLEPTGSTGKSERCELDLSAVSEDGATSFAWSGYGWMRVSAEDDEPPSRSEESGDSSEPGPIIVYDRSKVGKVEELFAPLNARYYGQESASVRVTKNFGDKFTNWLGSLPKGVEVELNGDLASLGEGPVSGRLRLQVEETDIDWFDLRVALDVTDTTLTEEEVKLLLEAKGRYVRLPEKGWRRLEFDISAKDDERLARLGLNPKAFDAEPQRLHALQLADNAARGLLPQREVKRIQRRVEEIKARVTPEIPSGVRAELRPYQTEGFHFLAYLATNRFGGILADDMGLGKTLQALTWILWQRTARNGDPAESKDKPLANLVVCPKSVMDNWRAEAEKFTPELKVKLWHAAELAELTKGIPEADVHVFNYTQLRLAAGELTRQKWSTVILDEGQYIKNPNSQTARAARALETSHRLVLTGTPIENRLMDLWSLMAFTMPGVLGQKAQFARLYDAKGDPLARRRLSARVRPFLLRRTKGQVAKDLPDRIEEDLFCEIEGEQKTLYQAELKRARQRLLGVKTPQELARERFHFLTSLLRLRQICCHPALVKADTKEPGAKLEALLEQLDPLMEEGHKVLVFSQFVELLGLVREALDERKWPSFMLTGETEKRGELVERFQTAKGGAVFLISLKAGGFGLNLTAASYVVLFDPWWNPAVENQAIDRTHRIGQTSNVIAYRLLIKDSIEEKIRGLQKHKSALAEDVLGEERFSENLSLDDLRFLFAD